MVETPLSSLDFRIADELSNVVRKKYGCIDYEYGINSASTDFVSVPVTYLKACVLI